MTTKNKFLCEKEKQQSFINHNSHSDNDRQYSNINLNQNYKCSNVSPVQSSSKPCNSKNHSKKTLLQSQKYQMNMNFEINFRTNLYLFYESFRGFKLYPKFMGLHHHKSPDSTVSEDCEEKSKTQPWNKSSINDSRTKFADSVNFKDGAEEEAENRQKECNSLNANNNSTLSVHITANENSTESAASDFLKNEESLVKSDVIQKQENAKQNFITSAFVIQNQFEFPRQQSDEVVQPEVSKFKASQRLAHSSETSNQGQQGSGMEAQKRPVAKPRASRIQESNGDLGPAPVPPTHRSLVTPLTDSEVRRTILQAPRVVKDEPGNTITPEKEEEPEYSDIKEEETVEENEKEKSPDPLIKLPSPKITEMPLSAILPKEELPPPLPPRNVYPKLETAEIPPLQEKQPLPKIIEPPKYTEKEAKVKYPALIEPVIEAGPVTVSSTSQYFKEGELLTEGQLLQYYQNEQLEFVDDFIEVFTEQELNPHNALNDLLEKYKDVCEKLQMKSDSKEATVAELTKVNNEVWHVEDKQVTENGRCGDDRAASGTANYKEAKFIAAKIVELKEKLDELSQRELDETLCLEIRARSLALQIQWTVVMINNDFLVELKTGASALPTLIATSLSSIKRRQLRGALSDLFFFLRFPVLPKRFSDSVSAWIVELTSVLYKACTADDLMFIVCQILRTPSPIDSWAIQLVQTFIGIPTLDVSKAMNNFVALLSIVMQSVKHREKFLCRVIKYYEGDNSWNVVSDDGDMDNATLTQINETDLVAIIGQFDLKALFLVTVRHFTYISQGNKRQVMLSLISFTLIIIKLLDEGLETYSMYKNVCKKIASCIKLLVQNVCTYWDLCKPEISNTSDKRMIQNEMNRIVLQAIYYIVKKKSLGLWQFLVDFPYSVVTENCRQRCQLLLRSPNVYNVRKLYEIADEDVAKALKSSGPLVEKLADIGAEDRTYMLSVLASVVSQSETDLGYFVDEMVRVAFLDEATRENYYKVGSEAVAVLIERCPKLLSAILNFIDRNVDHLDQYAVDILTNAPLSNCFLSKDDVGGKLAKWLINRPLTHPASHIARRVLTSVNWGSTGQLWMPQEVHDACADAIVKAHIVQCKNRNSLITKSYKNAAKLALKCPDLEQQFDKFCFDVLLRLKFVSKNVTAAPQNDLTAFFVYLMQKCLTTAEIFLENGIKPLTELVNSSSFNAAVVIIARIVTVFPTKLPAIIQNETFRDCIDKLLHADESSYAIQILMGADKFPGPVLKLFLASISYNLTNAQQTLPKDAALAWLRLLLCKKDWNNDKSVLFLLGTIVKIAFEKDPENLFGIVDILSDAYRNQLTTWKETSKGLFSMFSTPIPPPLLSTHLMTASPWASWVLLMAEPKVHAGFYSCLYASLQKHQNKGVEESVKKAASKSHTNLSIDRLDYYRWLELATTVSNEHPAFALICQQLCIVMFERRKLEKIEPICPGEFYHKCKLSEPMMTKLRSDVLPKAEKSTLNKTLASYYHAVGQWLFHDPLYQPKFNRYNDLMLDYLVQMITSGDKHLWVDFVPLDEVRKEIKNEAKIFSMACHLENIVSAGRTLTSGSFHSMTDFFNSLQAPSLEVIAFPSVPIHANLPLSDGLTLSDCCTPQFVLSKFGTYFDEISKISSTYVDGKERVNDLNIKYVDLFGRLYKSIQVTLIIQLKCGNMFTSKCQRPSVANIVVSSSEYDTAIAQQMNQNRQIREEEVGRLLTMLDTAAIKSAHLEFICRTLYLYGIATKHEQPQMFEKIRFTGATLFYHICNHVNTQNLLFPAGTDAYASCIRSLGSVFIAHQPSEQVNLMRMVLGGSPLNHFLFDLFTPSCVLPEQLFHIYSELSRNVRNTSTTVSSLELLKRLDIKQTGNNMPPNQFSALMPIIFENLISAAGSNTILTKLCSEHFVHTLFFHFPYNFVSGFALLFSGTNTQGIPTEIFETINDQLMLDNFLAEDIVRPSTKIPFDVNLVAQCIRVLSEQAAKSRQELTTRMFSVWTPYLNYYCRYSEYFIRLYIAHTFNSHAPTTVIEQELRNCFNFCIALWGPLLQPLGNGLAPWNPADNYLAGPVVEKLVKLLAWLPHSTYLPPGAETVEMLFWEYFSTHLMSLQRAGSSHIYIVYEEKLVSLNWARFWPTLMALSSMEKLMTDSAPEIGPLVTEIIIRIPWQQLVQHQQHQPLEGHRAFHSLLLSLLARCAYRAANFAKSRASVERLLASLVHTCQWYYTKAEIIEKVGAFIAISYPNDTLTTPNNVVKAFMSIFRQACFFSTTSSMPNSAAGDLEIIRKQAAYLRTDLRLMLKANWSITDLQKHFREILTKIDLIIGGNDKSGYIPLAKELTIVLPEITKEKTTLLLIKTLGEWLRDHPESGLVLLILNTAMESMTASMPYLGLKLLNKCIAAYFNRKISCDWHELCTWIIIPERSKEWLYTTPSADAGIKPRFLVLNAFLINEMTSLSSASSETALLKRLQEYLASVKPKYIKPKKEASFLLCVEKLQRMVIRQYSNGMSTAVANENLENYITLLKKFHSDEKGVSIFSMVTRFGRKPAYPIKIQLFSQILALYISQQQTAAGQPPRLQSSQGVLNSRLGAFKDLQKNKEYAEYNSVIQNAQPYFSQVEHYNLNHAGNLFARTCHILYPNDKTLLRLDA